MWTLNNDNIIILAEVASSHEGDAAMALQFIDAYADSGCDAIKFQIFRRENLLSRFHFKYDAFGQIEIAPERWREILAAARARGVPVVVEPFDDASLDLAESSGIPIAYKLPTSDISDHAFAQRIARTGKPVICGVGGATEAEIRATLDVLREANAAIVVLLFGFQSYPTDVSETHLRRLQQFVGKYPVRLGYADHIDAENDVLRFAVPAMAVAAGATVIEKHVTLDRAKRGRDHYSALNPNEFRSFSSNLRRAALARGDGAIRLSDAELEYRRVMKKQAVTTRALSAGTVLAVEHIRFKRTAQDGLVPHDLARVVGRRLRRDLEEDMAITEVDLE